MAIFFTQVFHHNFFHADMHPGNIFVLADNPDEPRYAAVDFGIMGVLDPRDQEYLAQNFLAVFDRDYRRVASLHIDSGWVPHDARIDQMEAAIRTICEPIFDRPLKDISFGVVLLRLFEALRRFDARIQPQLILLQKTLFNIEGLGRQLYPDLDIWKTASPILRAWMREKHHPVNVAQRLWKKMPELLQALEASPTALRMEVVARTEPRPSARSSRVARSLTRWHAQRRALDCARTGAVAGMVALSAARVPAALGWAVTITGAAWLLVTRCGEGTVMGPAAWRAAKVLWVAPCSIVGLLGGCGTLLCGGTARRASSTLSSRLAIARRRAHCGGCGHFAPSRWAMSSSRVDAVALEELRRMNSSTSGNTNNGVRCSSSPTGFRRLAGHQRARCLLAQSFEVQARLLSGR